MVSSKNDMINVGIIGTGRMGTNRARVLKQLERVNIKWICSRSRDRGEKFAREYDINEVITDWKQGCSDSDTEAVVITSPNNLHRDMAVTALENDLHVLLEYPIAVTVKESEEIIEAAADSKGKLHVGLTYKLGGKHREIKNNLQKLGKTGTCITVQCSGRDISRWFDDRERLGHVFVGSNIHFFDELIDWFGPVSWVDAHLYEEISDNKIDRDIGSMMLGFDNGTAGYVVYARGWDQPGLGFNQKIIAEKGYLVEEKGKLELWNPSGKKTIEVEDTDTILEDTKMFLQFVVDDKKPGYTPRAGLYAVRVAEAAYRAATEGKRVYVNNEDR